jgi:hypothetical protein
MRTLLLIVATAMMLLTVSCTPKSAMRARAVVLDSKPRISDSMITYKVRVLHYNITDFVSVYQQYEVGDTILIYDKYRNYEIRW